MVANDVVYVYSFISVLNGVQLQNVIKIHIK